MISMKVLSFLSSAMVYEFSLRDEGDRVGERKVTTLYQTWRSVLVI